jgi:hypothetical protein
MPFAYFQRLNRKQQAIYLRSDGVTTVPLDRPARYRPAVLTLAARNALGLGFPVPAHFV